MVTGQGIVSCLGHDVDTFYNNLLAVGHSTPENWLRMSYQQKTLQVPVCCQQHTHLTASMTLFSTIMIVAWMTVLAILLCSRPVFFFMPSAFVCPVVP